jgi:gamma-glutamylcyclotransferase (GGCT)/AIG2-like uncharacterized protein YtfP
MIYSFNPPPYSREQINWDATYNVFVYGTLKSHQANHDLLAPAETGSTFIGAAVSTKETYMMACNGGFPMVQDTQTIGYNRYKVIGEIYKIDHQTLIRLDQLESNGRLYSRAQKTFLVNLEGEPTEVTAWIYLYLGDLRHYSVDHAHTLKYYVDSNKSKLIEWSR